MITLEPGVADHVTPKVGTNETAFTLNARDYKAPLCVVDAPNRDVIAIDRAAFNQGANALYDFEIGEQGVNSTIVAKGPSAVAYKEPPHYIVRRLTPTECARLQGFPDRWGDINTKDSMTVEDFRFWLEVRQTYDRINGRAAKDYTPTQVLTWYNKLHTDSAEYKMWGNGIALPCALYVMEGIEEAYHEV